METNTRKLAVGNAPRRHPAKTTEYLRDRQKSVDKKEVIAIIKQIKSENKQTKWAYNDSTVTSLITAAAFFDVSAITQGITSSTRVGSSILAKKLILDMSFVVGDPTNLARFIVFRWIPDNGSDPPQASEIFDDASYGAQSSFLLLKPSRFKILFDFTVAMDTAHLVRHHKVKVPLNTVLYFNTGVNTGRNHIYCCYVADSGIAPHPTVRFTTQFVWTDTE